MKRNRLIWLISIMNSVLITSVCNAQTPSERVLEDIIEESSVNNDVEEPDWEDELEELSHRIREPLDMNTATRDQLRQFPFLTDLQIENLLAYIYINGPMQTVYELQLVDGFDRRTIEYLLPFVCVRDINNREDFRWKSMLKNSLKYGVHEGLIRLDIPFYKRKGYEHAYLGPSVYNSLKYVFRYRDNLYAGMTAEKDAGEPFGALHNGRGYDYYSFYVFLRRCGRLKALALGNYRISFGQGLVLGSGYLTGKTAYAFSGQTVGQGIRRHASTDEVNYFRGAAATLSLSDRWNVSAFYSHRLMDATVENGVITSMYRTGLHRSRKEAEKKDAFAVQSAGGNVSYEQHRIKLGISGVYYFFNRSYEPLLTGYSRYSLHGRRFYNLGMDYACRFHRFSVQGETAMGKQGWASLNRLEYSPAQGTKLMFIHRYYAYDYWAMFARSFSEGNSVENENGCYLAVETAPFRRWNFFASFDLFRFPWKKYRISKPSAGADGLFQATFSARKYLTMYLRYRYKQKERDATGTGGNVTQPVFRHQLRYRLDCHPSESVSCRTTMDYVHFHIKGETASVGYQLSQMLSYRLPWLALKAQVQGSYFCTGDYDSRVYIAEKGLLYTFHTPSFQGRGMRWTAHLRYDLNEHWMLIAKFGETIYRDRREIGSGNDLICGNKKADLQMQLRMKF